MYWKVTETETKVVRGLSVPIRKLSAGDVEERRRKQRLYYHEHRASILSWRRARRPQKKQYDDARKPLAKKIRNYVPASQLSAVEAEERNRKARERNRRAYRKRKALNQMASQRGVMIARGD